MKAENIKIFRLEDRILFEAAAAVEIVDAADAAAAVKNDPDANSNESERNSQNHIPGAPVENTGNNAASPIVDPDILTDIDAQIDAIVDGAIPSGSDAETDSVEAFINDNGTTVTVGRELAVINGNIKDLDSILEQIDSSFDVLILQDNNGLDELNSYLDAQDSTYSAIHFIVHGYKGEMTINGEVIDNTTFDAAGWEAVGEHLTSDGDILLYGCQTAASDDGMDLIDRIAEASGADVAASTDMTGLNGDWELEYTSGELNTAAISIDGYDHSLAATDITSFDDLTDALDNAAINGGDITLTIKNDINIEYDIFMDCDTDLDLSIVGDGSVKLIAADGMNIFSFSDLGDNQIDITIDGINFTGNGSLQTAIETIDIDTLSINNSTFTNFGNRVISVDSPDGVLNVTGSTFSGNTTFGGVIDAYCKDIVIDSSTFSNNSANEGGAIYFDAADGGSLIIRNNSQFINNSALTIGGAVSVTNADVTIENSYFSGNRAEDGGALEIGECGSVSISNSAFDNNAASESNSLYNGEMRGGAVHIVGSGPVSISNTTFYANLANIGGAVAIAYAAGTDAASIQNATFFNNTATVDGSAVYNGAGTLTVENSLLISTAGNDLHQQSGGTTALNYVFLSQDIADDTANVTMLNSKDNVTAAQVFGSNTYDTTTHTIAVDSFSEAAYSGTLIGTVDQLGNSRTEARDYLGVSKYAIGATAAQLGLYIKQNDITSGYVYTGNDIAVEKSLSLVFADGQTVIDSSKYSDLDAELSPASVRNAGEYTIDLSNGNVTLNSNLTSVADFKYLSGKFVVAKSAVTVDVNGSKIYDGTAAMGDSTFTYGVTYTNGGAGFSNAMFEVTDFVYSSKNVHTAQNAAGTAGLLNNAGNNFEVTFNYTGSITARDLNITANSGSAVYNGNVHTLSGATADNLVAGDTLATTTQVSGINAGTYDYILNADSITITDADGNSMIGNYNLLGFTAGALNIAKAAVTVDVNGSKIYDGTTAMGDSTFTYGVTYTNGGAGFDNAMFEVTDFVYSSKNVHTATAANGSAGLLNNAGNNFEVTFNYTGSITARDLNITANSGSAVYNGNVHTLSGATADNLVAGDTLATTTQVSGTNAGTYDYILDADSITITDADGNSMLGNYNLVGFTAGTLNIAKAAVTVDVNGSKIYDGTTAMGDSTFTYGVTYTNGGAGFDNAMFEVTDFVYSSKNVHTATAANGSAGLLNNAGNNFEVTFNYTGSITARDLNITANSGSAVYNGNVHTLSGATADNLVAGDTLATTAQVSGTNAGTYDYILDADSITITDADGNSMIGNYNLVGFTAGALNIAKAAVTVDVAGTKIYDGTTAMGDSSFTYGVTYTNSGAGFDNAMFEVTDFVYSSKNVHTDQNATGTAGLLNNAGNNFEVTFNYSGSITARDLNITANSGSAVYNGNVHTLSGATADNLVAGDTLATTTQVSGTNAGTYDYVLDANDIVITDADGNSMIGNYNLVGFTAGALNIAKAAVTVDVNGSKIYDGTTAMGDSTFTYGVTYTNGGAGFDNAMFEVTDFVYSSKNVHTDQNATGTAGLLNNAGNNFEVTFNYSGSITARDLNITANSGSAVYNGNVHTLSGATADNLVAGDTLATTTQVSGTNAGTYDYILDADSITITDADGNSMIGNYNLVGFTAGALNIAKAAVTVDVSGSKIYDGTTAMGDSSFTYGVTYTNGGAGFDNAMFEVTDFVYSSKNVHTAQNATGTAGLLNNAGNNFEVTFNYTGSITARDLNITANSGSAVYNGNVHTLSGATADNLVAGDTLATTAQVSGTNAGTYDYILDADSITITDADGNSMLGNYNLVGFTAGALNIAKAAVTVDVAGSKIYDGTTAMGDSTFTYGVTYTNGGAGFDNAMFEVTDFVYSSKNVHTATAATGTAGLLNNAGNNFEVTFNYTGSITARDLNITANSGSAVYNGNVHTLTGATADNLVAGDTLAALTSVTGTNAGTYDYILDADSITITDADGNSMIDNYNLVGFTAGALNIAKAAVTVDVNGSKIYDGTTAMGDSSFTYGVTYTNGGDGFDNAMFEVTDFVYSSKNVHTDQNATGSAGLLNNAGNNFEVTFNYTGSITARDLNITANSGSAVYNGNVHTLSGATADNLVAGDTLATTAQVSGTNAGTYDYILDADSITITDANGNSMIGNYNLVGFTAGALNIAKAAVTVEVAGTKTYDGTAAMGDSTFTYGVNYTNGGAGFDNAMFEVTDFVYSSKNVHTAQNATGTAGLLNNAGNNFEVTFNYTGSITARDLNITANSANAVYNGNVHTLSGATADNLVAGDTLATTAQVSGTNAGTYDYVLDANDIVITDADGNNMIGNYNLVGFTAGVLNIAKAAVTVDVNGSKIYDGTTAMGDSSFTYGVTYTNGGAGFDNAMFEVTDFVYSSKNVHTATAANGSAGLLNNAGNNFEVTFNYTGSITARDLNITANSGSAVYNGNVHTLSGATADNLVAGDTLATTAQVSGTNAGTYDYILDADSITITDADGNSMLGNYNLVGFTAGALNIAKAAVTVDVNGSKIYDGTTAMGDSTFTYGVTYTNGGAGFDNAMFEVTDFVYSSKNVHTATAANGSAGLLNNAGNNFEVTFNYSGSITARDLNITANSANAVYNGNVHTLSGATADNLVAGDTLATTTQVSGTNAGTYDYILDADSITITDADGNSMIGNYNLVGFTAGALNIAKAAVTVDVAGTKIYDGTTAMGDSTFTYGVTYTNGGAGFDNAMFEVTDFVYSSKNVHTAQNATGSAGLLNNAGNNFEVTFNYTGSITARDLNITANSGSAVYNGNVHTLSGATADNLVAGDTLATTTQVSGTNAGTYDYVLDANDITITDADGNSMIGNYNLVGFTAGALNIAKAAVTVDVSGSKIYDGTTAMGDSTFTYGVTYTNGGAGFDNAMFEVTDFVYSSKNVHTAQNATGTAGLLNNAGNNFEVTFNYTGSITARDLNITANSGSAVYNGNVHTLSGATADNLVAGDTLATTTQVSGTNAGTYDYILDADSITITDADGNSMIGNYNLVGFTAGVLNIAKAAVTVDVNGSKIYDGTTAMGDSTFTYGVTYTNGGAGFDNAMFEVTDFVYSSKNVHTDQNATGSAGLLNNAGNNFEVTFNYTGSITARDLNITANSSSAVYNGNVHTLSGATADNLVAGDTLATTTQVSGTNAGTYDYVLDANDITITDADGNSMLGNYNLVGFTAGALSVSSRPVEVIYVTSAPYEYTEADQSDTVSAYYIDVNGEKVSVTLDWNGQEFINPGLYTVTAVNSDPNYTFVNPSLTLVITNMLPSNGPFTQGLYPDYSSTVPAIEGTLLANGISAGKDWVDGNIYTLTWGQLASSGRISEHGIIELDTPEYIRQLNDHHDKELRVTVDPLINRPFELDAPQKEISDLVFKDSSVSKPQAFYLNRELFADANHPDSDYMQLFEKRGDSYSKYHDPVYVEKDYNVEEFDAGEISLRAIPMQLPAAIFRAVEKADELLAELALPELANAAPAATNFKSDLDELLESFAGV